MRNKRAKSIRRLAESLTLGQPYAEYSSKHVKNRIYKSTKGEGIVIPSYLIRLTESCTRFVYQKLKAGYKKGRHYENI